MGCTSLLICRYKSGRKLRILSHSVLKVEMARIPYLLLVAVVILCVEADKGKDESDSGSHKNLFSFQIGNPDNKGGGDENKVDIGTNQKGKKPSSASSSSGWGSDSNFGFGFLRSLFGGLSRGPPLISFGDAPPQSRPASRFPPQSPKEEHNPLGPGGDDGEGPLNYQDDRDNTDEVLGVRPGFPRFRPPTRRRPRPPVSYVSSFPTKSSSGESVSEGYKRGPPPGYSSSSSSSKRPGRGRFPPFVRFSSKPVKPQFSAASETFPVRIGRGIMGLFSQQQPEFVYLSQPEYSSSKVQSYSGNPTSLQEDEAMMGEPIKSGSEPFTMEVSESSHTPLSSTFFLTPPAEDAPSFYVPLTNPRNRLLMAETPGGKRVLVEVAPGPATSNKITQNDEIPSLTLASQPDIPFPSLTIN